MRALFAPRCNVIHTSPWVTECISITIDNFQIVGGGIINFCSSHMAHRCHTSCREARDGEVPPACWIALLPARTSRPSRPPSAPPAPVAVKHGSGLGLPPPAAQPPTVRQRDSARRRFRRKRRFGRRCVAHLLCRDLALGPEGRKAAGRTRATARDPSQSAPFPGSRIKCVAHNGGAPGKSWGCDDNGGVAPGKSWGCDDNGGGCARKESWLRPGRRRSASWRR